MKVEKQKEQSVKEKVARSIRQDGMAPHGSATSKKKSVLPPSDRVESSRSAQAESSRGRSSLTSPLQSPKERDASRPPARLQTQMVTDPVNNDPGVMWEIKTMKGALVATVYVEDGKACVEMLEQPKNVTWDFSSEELQGRIEGFKTLLLGWKADDDAARPKSARSSAPLGSHSPHRDDSE